MISLPRLISSNPIQRNTTTATKPLLKIVNVSKSFGTLMAVSNISFEICPGEVVGLAGRSGSGKSVLVKLLAGCEVPNKGEIYFAGRRQKWPINTYALNMGVVFQKPELIDDMDISQNIFLGNEILWPKIDRWAIISPQMQMDEQATNFLSKLGAHFPSLREKAGNLPNEQRQIVAIARAMARPTKLIIIDDPTPSLSYHFRKNFLSLIQSWQQQGMAVIFCSNNLDHLFAVTDRMIVLHQGRQVAHHCTDQTSREEIVGEMVGTYDRQALTPIIWALDSYYLARQRAEKLRTIQTSLEKDIATRNVQNVQLIQQLEEQVHALDQANRALQNAQRRLITEREEERKRLAREIHDEQIQNLLSVCFWLEKIETNEAINPEIKEELVDIRTSILELVHSLRHICQTLRPPTIDRLGLGAAIKSYIYEWSKRTEIEVILNIDTNLGRLPEAIELSVFRIVQEALSNVRRHANASRVEVEVKHTSPRKLALSIFDNGIGLTEDFDLSRLPTNGHYGLLGISERVALLGGRLSLQNQVSGGLQIKIEIPHPRPVS